MISEVIHIKEQSNGLKLNNCIYMLDKSYFDLLSKIKRSRFGILTFLSPLCSFREWGDVLEVVAFCSLNNIWLFFHILSFVRFFASLGCFISQKTYLSEKREKQETSTSAQILCLLFILLLFAFYTNSKSKHNQILVLIVLLCIIISIIQFLYDCFLRNLSYKKSDIQ